MSSSVGVRQIWRDDLESGMDEFRALTAKFEYISVNALWPGFMARPIAFQDYAYTTVKDTVNLCDALQIGFSFADGHGRKPQSTLQFNFVYHSTRTCIVEECMDALIAQGYDPIKAQTSAIDHGEFGECLLGTGLILNDQIKWLTFHGIYDLAFLFKILSNALLPDSKLDFIQTIREYFPTHYDVKYMLSKKLNKNERPPTLRQACTLLGLGNLPLVSDPDASCRAGINALLVSACFFNALKQYFENKVDDGKFNCCLYGLEDLDETKLPPGMLRLRPGTYSGPSVLNE